MAREGDADGACRLAEEALAQIPAEHRTSIVISRANALLSAVSPSQRHSPAVRHLSEVLTDVIPRLALDRR
jgi:hypothetical protein